MVCLDGRWWLDPVMGPKIGVGRALEGGLQRRFSVGVSGGAAAMGSAGKAPGATLELPLSAWVSPKGLLRRDGQMLSTLFELSEDPSSTHRWMGRVRLSTRGIALEDLKRNLSRYRDAFLALNQHWSFWLHFLVAEPAQMALLMVLLSNEVQADPRDPRRGVVRPGVLAINEVGVCMLPFLVHSVQVLHQVMGLPQPVSLALGVRLQAAFEAVGPSSLGGSA